MRCLSVRQPWADLLVAGRKSVEVRHWKGAPRSAIGDLVAIHAGRQLDGMAPVAVRQAAFVVSAAWQGRRGGIIGAARLAEVLRFTEESFAELADCHLNPADWYEKGLVGLVFEDPVRFPEVVPLPGQLGLWEVAPDVVEIVSDQVARARARPARLAVGGGDGG